MQIQIICTNTHTITLKENYKHQPHRQACPEFALWIWSPRPPGSTQWCQVTRDSGWRSTCSNIEDQSIHTVIRDQAWQKLKKPESGGSGATDGPWWGPGARPLVGVKGHSPLKQEIILSLRSKNTHFWYIMLLQTGNSQHCTHGC